MSESIELSPTPMSVAEARRWSGEVLERVGATEVADTMTLLVSELVSNVVQHARTPCSLRISRAERMVRVEVADGSDLLPCRGEAQSPSDVSGRGWQLISGLSNAHGVEPDPAGGKRVWFELSLGSAR